MKGIVRVTITHDRVGNNGIDLDSGHAGTAAAHRAQYVYATARSDDGVISVRAEHIGQRRRCRHEISLPRPLPAFGVDIHQVSGRVSIDDDRLALALGVHFDARDGVPTGELYPAGIAEASLCVNDIKRSP